MKIRSMVCLQKKPVQFKERVLTQAVLQARFITGCVIRETEKNKREERAD